MFSSMITRASVAFLLVGGLAFLFAPDAFIPILVPGASTGTAPLGQLLGAAWLAMAAFNWSHRSAMLGGIYGRPVVHSNALFYFVSGTSLLRAPQAPALVALESVLLLLAITYGALLFRGPFDPMRGPSDQH